MPRSSVAAGGKVRLPAVDIDPTVKEHLDRVALENDRTRTQEIRRAITWYLDQYERMSARVAEALKSESAT